MNIPDLRFRGFEGEWEERVLNQCLTPSAQKNFNGYYTKDDVLSVSGEFGVVNQIQYLGRSFAGISVLNYGIAEHGDIIYTKSPLKVNPYGIIKANKGKPGIVSVLYGIYSPNEGIDSNYIQCYFDLDCRLNNYLRKLVNKGAKNTLLISDEEALVGYIFLPTYNEQIRISKLIDGLDTFTDFQLQKKTKLLNLKRALLDKMFPKDGNDVPEIRFAGFDGAWKKGLLGNLVREITAGGDVDKTKLKNQGKYPVFANALTNNGIIGFYDDEFRIEAPAVTVTGRGDVGHAKARTINFTPVVRLLCIKSDFDIFFLENAINTHKVIVESTGVPQLTVPQLSSYEIAYPTLAEQQAIGRFFSHLDTLISLESQKLSKLRQLKKALLKRMFV